MLGYDFSVVGLDNKTRRLRGVSYTEEGVSCCKVGVNSR